jgi:hypothetical protein
MPHRHKANILYDCGWQHFDTGSPKAWPGLLDAMDRSWFEPTVLAKGDGPVIEAIYDAVFGLG